MTILTWVRKLLSSTSLPRGTQESQSRQQCSLAEFEHVYARQSRELYSFCLETVGERIGTSAGQRAILCPCRQRAAPR
jgi:hypothetical protein